MGAESFTDVFLKVKKQVLEKAQNNEEGFDINKSLVEYLTTPEFIKVHRQLEQLLGICRKQEAHVESQRAYRARIRNDLTIKQMEDSTNE